MCALKSRLCCCKRTRKKECNTWNGRSMLVESAETRLYLSKMYLELYVSTVLLCVVRHVCISKT